MFLNDEGHFDEKESESEEVTVRDIGQSRHFLLDSPKSMGIKKYLHFYNPKISVQNRKELRKVMNEMQPVFGQDTNDPKTRSKLAHLQNITP
jgi:hypothetical protein